jgi:ABC-2 type transport system permease protein
VPRAELPGVLHWFSYLLPMSYAVDATQQLSAHAAVTTQFLVDVIVVGGFLVAALALGATTLRRRTP